MDEISSVLSMAQKQKKIPDDPHLSSNIYRNDETIKPNVKQQEERDDDKEYEKSVFLDEKDQKLSREHHKKHHSKKKSNNASNSTNNQTLAVTEDPVQDKKTNLNGTTQTQNVIGTNQTSKSNVTKSENTTKHELEAIDEAWNALNKDT